MIKVELPFLQHTSKIPRKASNIYEAWTNENMTKETKSMNEK